jgi:hypothetical protein
MFARACGPVFSFPLLSPQIPQLRLKYAGNPFCPQPRGRNMKLLNSVTRFLASEDGAAGIENVVMVGCTVILCLSIQITARRHPETREAPAQVRSAFHTN